MGNTEISYSRVHEDEGKEGQTPIYRGKHVKPGEGLTDSLFGSIQDLKTMFNSSFENFPGNPYLGTREKHTESYVDEETKETKTRVTYGKYMYMTYGQAQEYSTGLAKSIIHKNLCPKKEMDGRNLRILGIYSKNREEWAMTDIACILSNISTVAIYETLGDKSIEYVINQTEMETIALGEDKLMHICKLKSEEKLPTIKNVILFDDVTEEHVNMCKAVGFEIYNIVKLAEGGETIEVELEDPKADDIFTI